MDTLTVPQTTRRSRQRAFDNTFAPQIKVAERRFRGAKIRAAAADTLLLREAAFISNDEFTSRSVSDVVEPDPDQPLFVERSTDRSDVGIIDQMAANRLLTHAGEAFYFRRMNFLMFWANAMRSTLKPTSATARSVARVEVLFNEAQASRSTIVDANLRLVLSLARKFSNNDVEFEDLVSEGSLILVKATDKFDFSRGFRFSTYATHSIQRHFFRRWKTMQRRTNLVQTSSPDVLADLVPVIEPEVDDTIDAGRLKPIMAHMSSHLDEREQHIVLERFGLGPTGACQTLRSLASDLGISKERVRQLQIKALTKLQDLATSIYGSSIPFGC